MLTCGSVAAHTSTAAGGWGIFNAIFGWQNSATNGSVISYNLFWLVTILAFLAMAFNEKNGHWPLMKAKAVDRKGSQTDSGSEGDTGVASAEKTAGKDNETVIEVQSNKS